MTKSSRNLAKAGETALLPAGYELGEVTEERHFVQVADLWQLCFGLDVGVKADELNFARKHCAYLYAVFYDKNVCATLAIIMFEMKINGVFVPCAGVASVATDPSHRHRKLVKALMVHSLQKMNELQVPVASLHPFSFPYYERMGFATSHLSYKIKAPISWLRAVSKTGESRNYKFTDLENFQPAMNVHERSLARWNATLRRPLERWRIRLFDFEPKWRLLCHSDGYMLWNTKDADKHLLNINEWNYVTSEAFLDGLSLLGTMESQLEWAQWIDGDIAPLLALGVSHPKPSFELLPVMMSRVVNVKAFEKITGKLQSPILDPLGISGPSENGSALKLAGVSPGVLFQQGTGFHYAQQDDNGRCDLLKPFSKSAYGANYCNDFF